jgi:hypothetical protein
MVATMNNRNDEVRDDEVRDAENATHDPARFATCAQVVFS